MSFAFPIAISLAAIALPIVALYILKVRLRRVPVSTNMFWRQIFEEKPPRALWQQFRHWWSLFLQLLLLLLIVLAVMNPYFSWQSLQARRVVMIVDNSASMKATDIRPTRLDAAKSAAADVIDGLRFHDELSIVVAEESPRVNASLTGHTPTLHEALRQIEFTDGPTSIDPAIALARKLIGDHENGEIIVFTDGCVENIAITDDPELNKRSTEEKAVDNLSSTDQTNRESGASVEYQIFSTKASNVGITQFQVRRSLTDPLGYETMLTVRNASANSVECRVELTLDEIPIDVLPLKLSPEEQITRTLEKTSLEGGVLRAELTQIQVGNESESAATAADVNDVAKPSTESPPSEPIIATQDSGRQSGVDGLAADNVAWAILPARRIQKVLVVSTGNLFLTKVFEANPLVEVSVVSEAPTQWPTDSLVVLHGRIPPQLPPGNVFVIDPIGECQYWTTGDRLENPLITEQDSTSPLMRHFRLDNVIVPEAHEVRFKDQPQVLASTATGSPIFASVPQHQGKCLVLTVSLDQSDLAFRTAFPIMVSNALSWFSGATGEFIESTRTGSVVQIPLATATNDTVQINSPTGKRFAANPTRTIVDGVETVSVTAGPLREAGLWTVNAVAGSGPTVESGQSRASVIAVNLADRRETDLRPNESVKASNRPGRQLSRWLSRPLWIYLTMMAVILTSVEWILYHRRIIC